MRHTELYIESVQGRRLTEHRTEDVAGYLAELGRLGRMEDWHFRQAVDAIRKLFELLGHRDLATTPIYTRLLRRGGLAVQSPMDRLGGGRSLLPRLGPTVPPR